MWLCIWDSFTEPRTYFYYFHEKLASINECCMWLLIQTDIKIEHACAKRSVVLIIVVLKYYPMRKCDRVSFPNLFKDFKEKKRTSDKFHFNILHIEVLEEVRCAVVSMSDILSNLLMISPIPPVPSESPFCWDSFLK